jgi:hypothetical protein
MRSAVSGRRPTCLRAWALLKTSEAHDGRLARALRNSRKERHLKLPVGESVKVTGMRPDPEDQPRGRLTVLGIGGVALAAGLLLGYLSIGFSPVSLGAGHSAAQPRGNSLGQRAAPTAAGREAWRPPVEYREIRRAGFGYEPSIVAASELLECGRC